MATKTRCIIGAFSHASYVAHLQRKFTEEIGFLPHAATRERLRQGNVRIALENGAPAGFLLGAAAVSNALHIRPIYQAAVQMDAQRRHHGLALLQELCTAAALSQQTIVQCFCRQELDANDFWRAAGFIAVGVRDVNAARGEPSILWRRPLVKMTAATLLELPPNPRNQTGGGRSVGRFAWEKLPAFDMYTPADISAELRKLELAA